MNFSSLHSGFMGKTALYAGAFLIAAIPASARPPETATPPDTVILSLDSCISIALNDNPLIRIADLEITRTDYSRRETIGKLLPDINFGGQYSRTLAKQTMYMNMDAFGGMGGDNSGEDEAAPVSRAGGGGDAGIKVGLDNSYSLGFNASLPLIAPQLWQTVKLNGLQILENVEKSRQSRQSTVQQVKSAYYTLLLAVESRQAISENYDMARFTAEQYVQKFKLGTASEFDTLRSAVAVRNIEPQLMQANTAIRQARLQLGVLMGLDPAIVAVSPDCRLADYAADADDNLAGLSSSIDNNSDLRLLDVQAKQLQTAHDINKMAWFPTLALTANYNWTTMSNGKLFGAGRWNPYSSVGLSLSFPLFQGGQRYNKQKQSSIQIAELNLQRENLENNLRTQVDVAIDNILTNREMISSCETGVKQAETAYKIQYGSFYNIGVSTYLDLRDSELALTQARLQHLQAIYNYLVARGQLEYILGTAPLERYGVNNNN